MKGTLDVCVRVRTAKQDSRPSAKGSKDGVAAALRNSKQLFVVAFEKLKPVLGVLLALGATGAFFVASYYVLSWVLSLLNSWGTSLLEILADVFWVAVSVAAMLWDNSFRILGGIFLFFFGCGLLVCCCETSRY